MGAIIDRTVKVSSIGHGYIHSKLVPLVAISCDATRDSYFSLERWLIQSCDYPATNPSLVPRGLAAGQRARVAKGLFEAG